MNYVIFGNSEADPITDLSANATLNWESGRSDESVGNGFKYSVADAYICTYVEAEPEPRWIPKEYAEKLLPVKAVLAMMQPVQSPRSPSPPCLALVWPS
ncbi:hypothetical protein BST95_18210 [Halioglobus japonicus]|uniref:hypothetical protein n=1 Tax=Halioglobus japonicus TaxID=930805 RepID=UPI000979187F|nr:hypothetical protein [Halioglobus japonicus]AQA19896.1 hypothetical protein BST95_18210 [Halioglobus japonicus]